MFVLHSDCNNVWNTCRYCSESKNSQTSDSQQLQPLESSSIIENIVVNNDSSSSVDTVVSPSSSNIWDNNNEEQTLDQQLLSTTSSRGNTDDTNVEADLPVEQRKQRIMKETFSQDNHTTVEEDPVTNLETSVSQQSDDGVVIAVAEFKNDQLLSSVGIEGGTSVEGNKGSCHGH